MKNSVNCDESRTWSVTRLSTFIQIFESIIDKSPENKFWTKSNNSGKQKFWRKGKDKVSQPWRRSNLMCNSAYGSLLPIFIQICESTSTKSAENEFWTKGNYSQKMGQPWLKSNLICNSSYESLLPTFIQICESITEKSAENEFSTKDNNS